MDIDIEIAELNRYIRILKIILALSGEENKELENIFDFIFSSDNLSMVCEECRKAYEFNTIFVKELKGDYLYTCQRCGLIERLGQYFMCDELLSNKRKILIDNSNDENWKLV